MTYAWTDAPPPWASMSPRRRAHVERVVGLLDHWADSLAVPGEEARRWRRAGWLHDALREVPPDALRPQVDAEFVKASPKLWHGPAAARRAAAEGEVDTAVLMAVRYHTVGHPDFDRTGQMLYLADFLEPGRRLDLVERAEWTARVAESPAGLFEILRAVVGLRIHHAEVTSLPVHPRTLEWWKALAS